MVFCRKDFSCEKVFLFFCDSLDMPNLQAKKQTRGKNLKDDIHEKNIWAHPSTRSLNTHTILHWCPSNKNKLRSVAL